MVGDEGDDFEDEIARMCVGNMAELGMLGAGRTGASIDAGSRDFGSELGIDSKLTAASILQ